MQGEHVLKLLTVNPMYYDTFKIYAQEDVNKWYAFSEKDAYNLCVNSYVLLSVPTKERFINPYYEYLFSVECTYMKKLDGLLQRYERVSTMREAQKCEFAYAIVKRLDQEAARRGIQFRSFVFEGKNRLGQWAEQQQWESIDRAFLEAQKEDIVQFLHLVNAQYFLERLVDELMQTIASAT